MREPWCQAVLAAISQFRAVCNAMLLQNRLLYFALSFVLKSSSLLGFFMSQS